MFRALLGAGGVSLATSSLLLSVPHHHGGPAQLCFPLRCHPGCWRPALGKGGDKGVDRTTSHFTDMEVAGQEVE